MSNKTEIVKDIAVRVAARVRPLVPKELREGCQECLDVPFGSEQVCVTGTEKAFTFDYAFPSTSSQDYIYDRAVAKMVKELFKGYNVTILAYGQTGSGKTYTMGTCHVADNEQELALGIIPRAVKDIFSSIADKSDEDILVKVSFIELYKESLYDLLSSKSREEAILDIREDIRGGIVMSGLTEIPVKSLEETMKCLEHGAMNRVTGATAMNARSSRSHAIFSLHIEIGKKGESDNIMSAKFHLVDLAGSERAKKTRAIGERFKEGVNINKGLLALGNVISALCVEGSKPHIPYRDSKLTRLLQDSLGGNSHTLMLACVSPADSNLEETLSTLRYADRARKIKNKPVVNRDPQVAELMKLKQQVQQLQVQLLSAQSGQSEFTGASACEVNGLLSQVKMLEEENDKLTRALHCALDENTNMAEKALMAEMSRDQMKTRLEELNAQMGNAVEVFNQTLNTSTNPQFNEQITLVRDLQRKIIELQAEQRRREQAIVDHELSRHSVSLSAVVDGEPTNRRDDSCDEEEERDDGTSPIKDDFGAAYTLRQAKLTEELQGLNRALAMKEELMSKMSANDSRFVTMKSSYERNIKDLEDQINQLMKEKDELNQKLRNASHQNASNKIAEQRRKRLQELEGLISGMRRKVTEQSKVLKMKEQSELKVTQLRKEIQDMKAVRVKLVRQMKEDNEKFRTWKNQKDREVAKLKEEDRKKQYKIVKMERLHTKQQNVLKRKMEEAVAINKRLKDAMALQKDCKERRLASRDIGNVATRINGWLEGELEVVTVKNEAKKSLKTLIEDRKVISDQLSKVKRQLSKGEFGGTMKSELEKTRESLDRELQVRTAQISDLQMKVVEEDGGEDKKRFDYVQTMVEAKCAMQYLFQSASKSQMTAASYEMDLKELNMQYEEVCQSLQESEAALKQLKEEHQKELSQLSRDHEEKILFLLRQMPQLQESEELTSNDEILLERLKFQEEELSRLSHLHDLLQQKTAECEELQKKLNHEDEVRNKTGEEVKETPKVVLETPVARSRVTQEVAEKKKAVEMTYYTPERFQPEFDDDDDDDDDESDDSSGDDEEERKVDPDWEKTPLFKRIQQITTRGRRMLPNENETKRISDEGIGGGVKRSSSGEIRCGCSKECSSKLCKCKKNDSICSLSCKCNALKCKNRSSGSLSISSGQSDSSRGETFLNSTFDVSLKDRDPLSENSANKKRKISENKKLESKDVNRSSFLSSDMKPLNFTLTLPPF